MKEQVKNMFEQVTMPEETEARIRSAMTQPIRKQPKPLWNMAATAAAVMALILVISPQARAAVEGWVVRYIFPDSGITVYEEKDENGDVTSVMVVDTEAPAFAQVRDERLYYTGNGTETDITDRITEEAPYYDSYVDDYGLTHYRVVGYSGTIENFGIYEFIRRVEEGQQPWEGWEGGSGRNFLDPETGARYPWVDIVWENLNIPWPMPE